MLKYLIKPVFDSSNLHRVNLDLQKAFLLIVLRTEKPWSTKIPSDGNYKDRKDYERTNAKRLLETENTSRVG